MRIWRLRPRRQRQERDDKTDQQKIPTMQANRF
jgi:hypothetical protein